MRDDTTATHVTTTSDHHDVSGIELDKVGDLSLLKVELDGVVDFDGGIGVADRATVVSDDVGHTFRANSLFPDF